MTLATLIGLGVAILGAFGICAERITALMKARAEAERTAAEPAQIVAQAASTMAASVEALLAPLHHELAALRAEVHALRDTLIRHSIPIPHGPFGTPPNG